MPRFPTLPNVGADLRDLFQQDRRIGRSRSLGASSITRGEGSLDLYETDDGPVTTRYGDQPDGRFGLGITHRGTFANISDLFGAGEDRDTAQDGRLDNHGNRISANETSIGGLGTRLNGAESRLGSAEGRLDNHASRIGSAEGRLNDHAGRIGSAEGRLDNHASRIGASENDIGDLESTASALASRMGAVEGKNSTQDGRLDSLAGRIGSAESLIAAKASQQMVQNLQEYVDKLHADQNNTITALRVRVERLEQWRDDHIINHAPDYNA